MFRPNLKFVALPVPEIIAIGILCGGCDVVNRQARGYLNN